MEKCNGGRIWSESSVRENIAKEVRTVTESMLEYHFREEMFTHSLNFVQAAQATLNPDYFKELVSGMSERMANYLERKG